MPTNEQFQKTVDAGAEAARSTLASSKGPISILDEYGISDQLNAEAIGWNSVYAGEENQNRLKASKSENASVPATGREVAFSCLSFGAKFKYTESEAAVWVKIGHDLIAGWKASEVASQWVGQPVCSFSDDGDVSATVWLLNESE